MPKVTFVKKARKDVNESIKKGDSYYHWSMRSGRGSVKRVSKTPPKPSQLTLSEFLGTMYSAQESVEGAGTDIPDVLAALEDAKCEIENQGEECQSKLDNMPEPLQQGPTGELLQSRIEACENITQSIDEAISNVSDIDPEADEYKGDDNDELGNEIQAHLDGIDWSFE